MPQQSLDFHRTEVKNPIVLIKSYASFRKYFSDVRSAKIITFCDSPEKMAEVFDAFQVDRLDIVVGDCDKDDYRTKLAGKPELASRLEELRRSAQLRIYVRKKKPLIHMKLYILETEDGHIRVLHGSPNFTQNAWGSQHESITVFEPVIPGSKYHQQFLAVWEQERDECVEFLEDLSREIDRSSETRDEIVALWVEGKNPHSEEEEMQSISKDLVKRILIPDTEARSTDPSIVLSLRNYDTKTLDAIRENYRHADISYDEQNRTLFGPRSAFAQRRQKIYGIPILAAEMPS